VIAPQALDAHRAVRRMIARGSHRVGHRQALILRPRKLALTGGFYGWDFEWAK
jgi:hypothetical protein